MLSPPWGIMSCVPNVAAVRTDSPLEGADLSPMIKQKKRGNNPAKHRRGAVPPQAGVSIFVDRVTQGHLAPGSRTGNASHFGHKPSRWTAPLRHSPPAVKTSLSRDQFAPGLNGIKCAHGLRAGIRRLTG